MLWKNVKLKLYFQNKACYQDENMQTGIFLSLKYFLPDEDKNRKVC